MTTITPATAQQRAERLRVLHRRQVLDAGDQLPRRAQRGGQRSCAEIRQVVFAGGHQHQEVERRDDPRRAGRAPPPPRPAGARTRRRRNAITGARSRGGAGGDGSTSGGAESPAGAGDALTAGGRRAQGRALPVVVMDTEMLRTTVATWTARWRPTPVRRVAGSGTACPAA